MINPGEVTVNLSGGLGVCHRRLKRAGECSQMHPLPIRGDRSRPGSQPGPGHAFVSRRTGLPDGAVGAILPRRRRTKIDPSAVEAVGVDVVKFSRGWTSPLAPKELMQADGPAVTARGSTGRVFGLGSPRPHQSPKEPTYILSIGLVDNRESTARKRDQKGARHRRISDQDTKIGSRLDGHQPPPPCPLDAVAMAEPSLPVRARCGAAGKSTWRRRWRSKWAHGISAGQLSSVAVAEAISVNRSPALLKSTKSHEGEYTSQRTQVSGNRWEGG